MSQDERTHPEIPAQRLAEDATGQGQPASPRGQGRESARPSLTAIIVYYRTPVRLVCCLQALSTQSLPLAEIIVVDNSSAIDGLDVPPIAQEGWRWVRAERNLGFGAACNLGAAIAHGDYLMFLNADLVLAEDACEQLWSVAQSSPDLGVIGPRIYGADGQIELSARAFPSVTTALLGRSSLLTQALTRLSRTPPGVSAALGQSTRVDWVSGACMFMRREAFEQVNGFDEKYWMYWEDADICRRLRDLGWSTMLWINAQGHHSTGSSGRSEQTIAAFHDSAARYYERHVAGSSLTARLARGALGARKRMLLHRHDHQT